MYASLRNFVKMATFDSSRFFGSVSKNHGEYSVRHMLPNESWAVSQLISRDFPVVTDPGAEDFFTMEMNKDELWAETHEQKMLSRIVAVKNGRLDKFEDLYGAVDLNLAMNLHQIHSGFVPSEWMASRQTLGKDSYITNLVVAREARRRLVATNLLRFALDEAVDAGMVRVFAFCDPSNDAVQNLNTKLGFKILMHDDITDELLMGMKL